MVPPDDENERSEEPTEQADCPEGMYRCGGCGGCINPATHVCPGTEKD